MYTSHAELKTGIVVVLAALVLLGLLVFATGEGVWGHWERYQLVFQPGDLAASVGDPVIVNGVEVGKVEEVELRHRPPTGYTAPAEPASWQIHVWAVAKVRGGVQLPDDTQGRISESITGARELRLIPGRSATRLTPEASARRPLVVRQSATLAAISEEISGIADKVGTALDQFGSVATDVRALLAEAKSLVASAKEKVDAIDMDRMNDDLRAATGALRTSLEGLEARLAVIGENAEAASVDLRRVGAAGAHFAENLDRDTQEILATLKEVAKKLDAILANAGPKVDVILDDIGRTARNLAGFTEDIQGLGPEARAVLKSAGGNVDELLRTLQDVGQNLLDASEDIRAHPWKLLNEPSEDQIAFENLRDAMQGYGRAMRDMERSARTLRDLLASDPSDPDVQARVRRTLAELEANRDRYRRMEALLLELLQRPAPAGR